MFQKSPIRMLLIYIVDVSKAFIKKKVTAAAHGHLTSKQADHSKVSEIKYVNLETQP